MDTVIQNTASSAPPPQLTQSTDNSAEAFLKEVQQPTTPALDGGPKGFNIPAPEPAPEHTYTPPEDTAENVFTSDDTPPEGDAKKEKPNYSEDYKKKTLRYYINLEENGTAWLAAKICKTKDTSLFKYSPEAKEFLAIALEPYMDTIIEMLPLWVPPLLVYIGLKADQITTVMEIIQTNKQNTAGKADNRNWEKFNSKANTKEARTNFKLYNDGYYENYPTGGYVKRDSPDKEKPSFNDIDKILEANPLSKVLKAFDITEQELRDKGVTIPE